MLELMLRLTVSEKTDPLALTQLIEWARRIGVTTTSETGRKETTAAQSVPVVDEPAEDTDEENDGTDGTDGDGKPKRRRRTKAQIAADNLAAQLAAAAPKAAESPRLGTAHPPVAQTAPVAPTVLPPGYVAPVNPPTSAPVDTVPQQPIPTALAPIDTVPQQPIPTAPVAPVPTAATPTALPNVVPLAADSGITLEDVRAALVDCEKIKPGQGFVMIRSLNTGKFAVEQVDKAHYPRLMQLAAEFLGSQSAR